MDASIIAALITAIGSIIAAVIIVNAQKKNKIDIGKTENSNSVSTNASNAEKAQEINYSKNAIDMDFIIGVCFIIICSILYGASHVISRKVISDFHDPIVVATIRNLISGLIILGIGITISFFSNEKNSTINWDRDAVFMILGRGMNSIFYFSSFLFMSATVTITLHKLDPIFTMILLVFVLKSRIRELSVTNIIFGLLVSILGSILTISGGMDEPPVIESIWGIPVVLLAGLSWSVFIVASEKHNSSSKHTTKFWQRQVFVGKTYMLSAIPAALWIAGKLFIKDGYQLKFSIEQILWILLLSVIASIIGVLYFEALKRISSLLVGILISLEIFFTMIFESLWLGNSLHWNIFIGAILVLIGAFSIGRESKKLKI